MRLLSLHGMKAPWLGFCRIVVAAALLQAPYVQAQVPRGLVTWDFAGHRLPLVHGGVAVPVMVDDGDHEVVRIAAGDLSLDIERVTGVRPEVVSKVQEGLGTAVIIGSLDRADSLVSRLAESGKLDARRIRGKWEAFTLQVVEQPVSGLSRALVIAGSDRRGTAYGVYELSRQIGVSPWVWWADVTPVRRQGLYVEPAVRLDDEPQVKYRGIYINDEMWGLRAWAEGTFAPQEGRGLGPKTYARVFELLLRLRANTLWPAMHQQTRPFNDYPDNKLVADRYAIVMGTSHNEPMLRNNMPGAEWDREHPGQAWDYTINRELIRNYWQRRIESNARCENIYTLGMRGQDDGPMNGGGSDRERIGLLELIMRDQRDLIARLVNPDVEAVPQVFIPYTEVLHLYNAGLKVPADVTICWPDDNFGYIRRLPDEQERRRPGGSGVYYHLQWLNGATTAYTWLNTMPPSLIFSEMNKAWQHDCRQLWILNVGDIKPMEVGMDFFLEMAWNPERWNHDNIGGYLEAWARRDLDVDQAGEIAAILKEYYQLAMQRRPEHLVQHRVGKPLQFSWFSHRYFGDEAARRLETYADLARRAEVVYQRLSPERRDAGYQLLVYPVQCAALMNAKVIHAERSLHDAALGSATARVHALQAREAAQRIIELTERYNTGLETVGDKWRHMMSWAPGPWGRQRHQFEMPPLSDFHGSGKASLLVVPEGDQSDMVADLSIFTQGRRFIDLFNTGEDWIQWQAEPDEPWVRLNQSAGSFREGCRLWLEVDWKQAPRGGSVEASVTITSNAGGMVVKVPVFAPDAPLREVVNWHVESHGCVSIEAEHFSRCIERGGGVWKVVDNLGRSGDSVTPFPATLPSIPDAEGILSRSPSLEYDFQVFEAGEFRLHLDCLPTQPLSPRRGVQLAVSLDDGPPCLLGAAAGQALRKWDVLQNLRRWQTVLKVPSPGLHTLKVWMVDPGVVLDRIVIFTKPPRESNLGPPESFRGMPAGN